MKRRNFIGSLFGAIAGLCGAATVKAIILLAFLFMTPQAKATVPFFVRSGVTVQIDPFTGQPVLVQDFGNQFFVPTNRALIVGHGFNSGVIVDPFGSRFDPFFNRGFGFQCGVFTDRFGRVRFR